MGHYKGSDFKEHHKRNLMAKGHSPSCIEALEFNPTETRKKTAKKT